MDHLDLHAEVSRCLLEEMSLLCPGVVGDHHLDAVVAGFREVPDAGSHRHANERGGREEGPKRRVHGSRAHSSLERTIIVSAGVSARREASGYPSRDPMEQDNLPAWTGKPGRYEVWFLTMSDGRQGYWIRATLLAPSQGPGEARLWFARFDREDPSAVFGINRAFPLEQFRSERDEFEVHVGGSVFRSGHSQSRAPSSLAISGARVGIASPTYCSTSPT